MLETRTGGFQQKVVVGIADLAVSNNAHLTLTTYSLGSCLGVAIFDPVARVGGLLHAMLPESALDPSKAIAHPAMFVDTGVPALFRAAYDLGADKHRLQIFAAGGAQSMDTGGFFGIARRNYEALTTLLHRHRLQIEAEHVGGHVNRVLSLNLVTGQASVKTSGQSGETVLCKSSTTTFKG